ncbi:hypothetical protein ACFW0I_35840 [[Kitasatospora] papulosa]|uniref:hypothetical protein n=1 Tax=[Kitasatospora] papulosa TaxID=1464011 RepID=UPI0036B927DC
MADTYPSDLVHAQRRLHQARAEYEALCLALPWSVEPSVGWPGEEHPHTDVITAGREDSPGFTDEQKADVARLRELVCELSIEVSTHPYWATLEGEARVEARMVLKHHPDATATPPETEQ